MDTTTLATPEPTVNPPLDDKSSGAAPTHAIDSTAIEEPTSTRSVALVAPETRETARYSPGATELIHGASAAERVAVARDIATALNDVIVSQGLRTKVGSKKKLDPHTGEPMRDPQGREIWEPKWHVDVEGWQTLATLLGCAILPRDPQPVIDPSTGRPILRCFDVHEKLYHRKSDGGGLKAERTWTVEGHDWKVTTDIVKDGVPIGSATGLCSRTEAKWKESDEYAVQGMAATRSMSRAIATAARWIVALAGYSTTPSEEMPANAAVEPDTPAAAPPPAARIEQEHRQAFIDALARLTDAKSPRDRDIMGPLYRALTGDEALPTVEVTNAILAVEYALGKVLDRHGSEPIPSSSTPSPAEPAAAAPTPASTDAEVQVPLDHPNAAEQAGRAAAEARTAAEQRSMAAITGDES